MMEEKLVIDFFTEENTHWWHKAKRELIKKFIIGKNLSILVAGVGGGMICGELKAAGHRVIGLDISGASCEYVNKKIGVPVVRADLEALLPFVKEAFDIVILADVLEHLSNEKQLLGDARFCLKPLGAVIITVPAYTHMWSYWDNRLNHKRRYSLATVKNKIGETGLKIKKASYYHMLLYPFAYFYRIILCSPRGKAVGKSDFSVLPGKPLAVFFTFYYHLERFLLKIMDLPFGLSILIVGVKYKADA
jgi:SAM-dependent methyltransferase